MAKGKIRVATCQFAESFQPRRNAAIIVRYMRAAARKRAEVVHFHEAALTGYLARKGAPRPQDVDWPAVRQASETICAQAKRLGLWVILGSAHPLTPPHKPTNCLYLISPEGAIVDRYDKRFCTEADLKAYTPGDRFVTFRLNGLRCALLICFDLRFPELYRQLARRKIQVVFQSFHNGYMDGPGVHGKIMRQTMQAHAGINYFWASVTNSSGPFSRWPSVLIQPDGVIAASLRQNAPGLMVHSIDTTKKFYDASGTFRQTAIRGVLHSGKLLTDRRQEDTRSL